jgi:hypothetical protein
VSKHPFRIGRRPLVLPWVVALNGGCSFLLWFRTLDIGSSGIPLVEMCSGCAAMLAIVTCTPRMGTWEATGQRHPRRLAALVCGVAVASASLTPLFVGFLVTKLPASFVPGSARFPPAELDSQMWEPIVSNVLLLGFVSMLLVPYLGRALGCGTAVSACAALALAGLAGVSPAIYSVQRADVQEHPYPIVGAVLAVFAIRVWIVTGGQSNLARRIGP